MLQTWDSDLVEKSRACRQKERVFREGEGTQRFLSFRCVWSLWSAFLISGLVFIAAPVDQYYWPSFRSKK